MSNGKVVVTGGAGYIGSHTVVELVQSGYEVLVIDDFSNAHHEVIGAIGEITGRPVQLETADMCDRERVLHIFRQFRPDAVIHFAASKFVGESVNEPLKYYHNNISSLIAMLEAVRETGCRRVVFSSSCTVYGQPDENPVTENTPLKPAESPYGNTKRIGEEILRDFSAANDVRVVSLRYFNPVGAHESGRIGEYPLGPPSNLMPVITQAAAGIRKSFAVFGTDYPTRDGTCIRDYIHVSDVAAAHVKAIGYLAGNNDGPRMDFMNLGTGNGTSVLEMVHCFEKVNNIKLNYTMGARRPGDVAQVWADSSKANQLLQWRAARTLSDMVATAWKWEQSLLKLHK